MMCVASSSHLRAWGPLLGNRSGAGKARVAMEKVYPAQGRIERHHRGPLRDVAVSELLYTELSEGSVPVPKRRPQIHHRLFVLWVGY